MSDGPELPDHRSLAVEQLGPFENDYEGLQTECPYCALDPDVDDTPRPYLANGSCHECGHTFEVRVHWAGDGDGR